MPIGVPNPFALSSRKVCAFSLDTSVIEGAGFRFGDGPLRHLSWQLPPWFQLWMPDIVAREISQHRLENVSRSVKQVQTGMQELRRHMGDGFDQLEPAWLLTAMNSAENKFDDQLQNFLKSHNGVVLEPNHVRLSAAIFNMYFDGRPPFGGGRDKKHEFPDAASLVMLEFMAAEKGVQAIAVSKDAGWAAYANQSPHIYCVPTLQDLTALFVSQTPLAKSVIDRLGKAFKSPNMELQRNVKSAIEGGLISLPWRVHLPRSYRYEFETSVFEAKLKSFDLIGDAIGVWITSRNDDACVAEMPVEVDVSLRIEVVGFTRDWSGDKVDFVRVQTIVDQRLEIKVQLELAGELQASAVEDLLKNMSLSESPVDVHIARDSLGPNWIGGAVPSSRPSGFDDMDDDIPF